MNRIAMPLLAASFAASGALAQEEQDQENLEEIIVSATPLDRTADELTQSALLLTKEQLLLRGEASIGETLSNELGISTTYFGPVAGRPVIRGQAGPRVSVLENGIAALDVSDLSPDHAVSVEPLFADRIEVIRGPATLLYGSSAAGGVVNVVDGRVPESAAETPVSGAAELRGDTAANENALVGRLDGGSGPVAWHLDGFHRETDDIEINGFATSDPEDRPADEESGTVLNSAGEGQGYAGGASLVGEDGFLGVSYSRYENEYGLPGPEEGEEEEEAAVPLIADGPFIELEQDRIDLRSEYRFDSRLEKVRFRFGKNDYEHAEIEPTGEVATQFKNDAWEGRFEAVHAPLGGWRGAVGLQVGNRDFSAIGDEAFIPPTTTDSYGLFLLEEHDFDNGLVELGARVDSVEHDPLGDLRAYDETAFSVAAGLHLDFANDRDLSVNLSRSERHPDAAELYSNGAHLATGLFEVGLLAEPGGAVDQEVATNLDVALHHHSDQFNWKIGVFYNDIANYTYRQTTAVIEDGLPLTPYVQQDAEFYGYEAEIGLPFGTDWNLRLFTDYVRGKTDDGDLPRIQPLRLGAALDYTGGQWSAGLEGIYHSKQDDISSFHTDSFTMLNANVVYRLDQDGSMNWEFFVKGTNLLDEDARRSTSFRAAFVPLPGASLHAGIRASFD
ncbi:MAG TPA: TonB-dependent receptor [Woeseiaceae bacterium]|nr:TonB-dependent receptor [Woeseiaceae bacterium]